MRGSLEVGKLADLAVLSQDYLTVPVEKIGSTESLLTWSAAASSTPAAPFAAAGPAPHRACGPTTSTTVGAISSEVGDVGRGAPGRARAARASAAPEAAAARQLIHHAQEVGRQPAPHRPSRGGRS